MVDSRIRVNGINETINKFNTKDEIVNLDLFKEKFKLDKIYDERGDVPIGFYRLSLSYNTVLGDSSIMETFNNPPLGDSDKWGWPLPTGTYCKYCGQEGSDDPKVLGKSIINDHSKKCKIPENSSLRLTILGVNIHIVKNYSYKGDYKWIQDMALAGIGFSREDLSNLLLDGGESIEEGTTFQTLVEKFSDEATGVKYVSIKRGPAKLAPKTTTVHFLNNLVIYFSIPPTAENPDGHKTSIRISKNGLINIINTPQNPGERIKMLTELLKRINELPQGTINMKKFNDASKSEPPLIKYTVLDKYSYSHSISGQFSLWGVKEREIDFSSLNNLISPFNSDGGVTNGKYSTVNLLPNDKQIINVSDNGDNPVKIIEWVYSVGRLTRNQIMSKEYIKFVSIPAPGIRLTTLVNKFGTFQMTLSKCPISMVFMGLCEDDPSAVILEKYFNNVYRLFNTIFQLEGEELSSSSLSITETSKQDVTNTSNSYQPDPPCRKTRLRYEGTKAYTEFMRPFPYSWRGECPDPNYQYIDPQGLPSKNHNNGKVQYYPCCSTLSSKSRLAMKLYLKYGFPLPRKVGAQYPDLVSEQNASKKDIPSAGNEDLGSGILIPGSNIQNSVAFVHLPPDDEIYEVKVLEHLMPLHANKYKVQKITRDPEGKIVLGKVIKGVLGTNFVRENRRFPGLVSFNRDQLLTCITNIMRNMGDVTINKDGQIMKSTRKMFSSKLDSSNLEIFNKLFSRPHNIKLLTYAVFTDDFLKKQYILKSVPIDSYHFYLVLSPQGNFYISGDGTSFESEISETFDKSIVLDGFLERGNEKEIRNKYHVTDVLYFNDSVETGENRERLLASIQNFYLNNVDNEELIFFPEEIDNIIEGSYLSLKNEEGDEDSELKKMLIFMNSDKCCDYILWDPLYKIDDEFVLQIMGKTKITGGTELTFGFKGKLLSDKINFGIDRIFDHSFNSRDMPNDLKLGDNILLRILRNSKGDIVPKRFIKIIGKYEYELSQTFDDVTEMMSLIINPINSEFFETSATEWVLPSGRILNIDPDNNKLKEFVM